MEVVFAAANSARDSDVDVVCNGEDDSARIQRKIKTGANLDFYAGLYNIDAELLIGSFDSDSVIEDVTLNLHPGAVFQQPTQVVSTTTTALGNGDTTIRLLDKTGFKPGARVALKSGATVEANLVVSKVKGNSLILNSDNGGVQNSYPIGAEVILWNNCINICNAKHIKIQGGLLEGNRAAGGYESHIATGMDWGQCGIINAGPGSDYNVEDLKILGVRSRNWFFHAFHTVGPVRGLLLRECRASDCLSGDGFNLDSHGFITTGYAGVQVVDCEADNTVSGFRMADCNNVIIRGGETHHNTYWGIRLTNNYPGTTGKNPLVEGVYVHDNALAGFYLNNISGGRIMNNIVKEATEKDITNSTTTFDNIIV